MSDDRDAAARRSGPHDAILFGKRPHHLNACLKSNSTIPINRDVPPTSDALSPQCLPDATTTLGNHAREFRRPDLTAQDGERCRWQIVEMDNE